MSSNRQSTHQSLQPCAAVGPNPPAPAPRTATNTQGQQNAALTNLLKQLANGIPGLPGGPLLPLTPPPVLTWLAKDGITGPEHKAFFTVELGL